MARSGSSNGAISRSLVLLTAISGLLAVGFTNSAIYQSVLAADSKKYIYQNVGTALVAIMVVSAIALIASDKYAHLPSPFRLIGGSKSADPNIFRKAYTLFAVLVLLFLWLVDFADHRLRFVMICSLVVAYLVLPTAVAVSTPKK